VEAGVKAWTMAGLVLVLALPASAQSGPSFDCGKAGTPIERTICGDGELAKADRDVAAVYVALASKLTGPAKDHLVKDQVRWVGDRNRACATGALETVECLKERYDTRLAFLRALSAGAYPFITEQTIIRSGKIESTRYAIDASYPQFDNPSGDFGATNRHFGERTRAAVAQAMPQPGIPPDIEQIWTYQQSFVLHRPAPHAICVELTFYAYTGGAHGNGGTSGTLVDMRTGRVVPPASVFFAGDEWLRTVTDIVVADLRKQFVERPGFDDALEPKTMAKLLAQPAHYLFQADKLEILFNPYDIGPYAAGPYSVEIPYAKLRPLIRPDGPLGK
jgi:uncharacterized protein